MLTIEQVDAIRNNLEYYIKSELDGIIPPEIDSIFEILGEADDNNLSEILPVRDAQAAKNKDLKYAQSPEDILSVSINEASVDCEDEYNFIEHTSECS